MKYCDYTEHIWVRVVDGKIYNPDFETDICIRCECARGIRKPFDGVTE